MQTTINRDGYRFDVSINIVSGFSVPVVNITICEMALRKFFSGWKVKNVVCDTDKLVGNVDRFNPMEEALGIISRWLHTQRNIQKLESKINRGPARC